MLDHLPHLEEALDCFPGLNPILMGNLNANIYDPTVPRNQTIATLLATYGLLDMLYHFRQRAPYRHCNTWHQVREGQLLHPGVIVSLAVTGDFLRQLVLEIHGTILQIAIC